MRKFAALLVVAVLAIALAPAAAQDDPPTPAVTVSDQLVFDGHVVVDNVISPGLGWMVIHADNGDGAPGPVIGWQHLHPGQNNNVRVQIDTRMATPTLFAMLHEDTGVENEYEFGAVEGADGPVRVDGNVVTPPFNIELIDARPQFIAESTFLADVVVTAQPGWLVIHADGDGRPGPVIGFAEVQAGANSELTVPLDSNEGTSVWPMLHVDTGEAGVYEFGQVEGADAPVMIDGQVATFNVPTAPSILANPQIVVNGDNRPEGMMMMDDMADDMSGDDMGDEMEISGPTFTAQAVLSDGPGWLVVHAAGENGPGPVIGFAPVTDGFNANVRVELDAAGLTPVLWPMLHVDTGEAGVYEFGAVEGADGPVRVNDAVVTFPVNVAPSFMAAPQPADGAIEFDMILADATAWMVIHASVDGAPGPVIGFAQVNSGVNFNISVPHDDPTAVEGAATDQVFPMLHYDTGVVGEYEFGQVEGADGPVMLNGNVVVGPLEITAE